MKTLTLEQKGLLWELWKDVNKNINPTLYKSLINCEESFKSFSADYLEEVKASLQSTKSSIIENNKRKPMTKEELIK